MCNTLSDLTFLADVSSSLAAETFGGCCLCTEQLCAIASSLIRGQAASGCSQCRRDRLFIAAPAQRSGHAAPSERGCVA